MTIPTIYRRSGEAVIASYNYTDIVEGTGIVSFYLADTIDLKILTTNAIYSQVGESNASAGNDSPFVKVLDVDFDATFNLPKIIKGTAYFNIPFELSSASVSMKYGYLIVRVRKWDGTTETEIASNQGQTLNKDGTAEVCNMESIDVEIPQTHFKKGETLRITIEGWGYANGGTGSAVLRIGHDPQDQSRLDTYFDTPAVIPAIARAHIPFKIDL